jgi:hypothetical protein
MVKEKTATIKVTESSGNVIADMGLPEPEDELNKAQLASHIRGDAASISSLRVTRHRG